MIITGKAIAGITIPDSTIANRATELLREHGSELLYNHSLRAFLFSSLNARQNNVQHDIELLYVSAMLHDLGLTSTIGATIKDLKLTVQMRPAIF